MLVGSKDVELRGELGLGGGGEMWVLWRLWNEKGEFPGERVKAADGWGGGREAR